MISRWPETRYLTMTVSALSVEWGFIIIIITNNALAIKLVMISDAEWNVNWVRE